MYVVLFFSGRCVCTGHFHWYFLGAFGRCTLGSFCRYRKALYFLVTPDSCLVFCLLFLLFYVISAPVAAEVTEPCNVEFNEFHNWPLSKIP